MSTMTRSGYVKRAPLSLYRGRLDPRQPPVGVRGSSTLLVTLILLLLSGSSLALLMATQTQMLIASGQKLRARLLAAAEGGVQLAVARGVAGAADPYTRTLGAEGPGAEITVEVTGFVPMADGACYLCMANLDGGLGSLGGLGRVSHVAGAFAWAPSRLDGLPPPGRELTAVVDLMPWPVGDSSGWELAGTEQAARDLIRNAALGEGGAYDEDAPLTVTRVADSDSGAPRTVAIGGPARAGRLLYVVGMDSGQVLYEWSLDAPVTAAPAAADTTGDGLADRIYVGTTAGGLYRVDVPLPVEVEGGRIPAGAWKPRRVFDTGNLPIHHPPAVIPAPALGAHVLALGAGGGADPEAGSEETAAGRFFVLVERGSGGYGPADELPRLDPESPHRGIDRLAPAAPPQEQGWSLAFGAGERPASAPLAVGGLLTFFTLRPTGPDGGEVRKYALRLDTGDAAGPGPRARLVDQGAAWPSPTLGAPTGIEIDHPGSFATPILQSDELAILEELRGLMPERCRFDGSRIRLTGPGPDGSPIRLAVLPVCRIEVDWTEGGL